MSPGTEGCVCTLVHAHSDLCAPPVGGGGTKHATAPTQRQTPSTGQRLDGLQAQLPWALRGLIPPRQARQPMSRAGQDSVCQQQQLYCWYVDK